MSKSSNPKVDIVMKVESKDVTLNGNKIVSNIAPIQSKGRVLIPIKTISDIYGSVINWNDDMQTLIIYK